MMQMFLLLFALVRTSLIPVVCGSSVPVPVNVSVHQDVVSQSLRVCWCSDSSLFHIQIYQTPLMELVFNDTVSVSTDPVTGTRDWSWYSQVPLQCTSHSVQIRALDHGAVSQWSPLLTIPGNDVPDQPKKQMYPQDPVLLVGSNVTVCCILPEGPGEGGVFSHIHHKDLEYRKLSERSYSATITNLQPSASSGTNIICFSKTSILTGTVLFVGYPPGDEGLQCETRDLKTADCQWRRGRDTHLLKRSDRTTYTLNNRRCTDVNKDRKLCRSDRWEKIFTLVAQNPLGSVQLNDSAPITHRVRLLPPVNMTQKVEAWQAVVEWSWTVEAYRTLEMVCQLELNSRGRTDTRNYTGVGLSMVKLNRLVPDVEYTFSIRCASLQHFWRWGDWSAPYCLHTSMDRPGAVDVWVWRSSEYTAHVVWKLLSDSDAHGALLAYEVSERQGQGDRWRTVSFPPTVSSTPINLNRSGDDVIVAVAAQNPVGLSDLSNINIPPYISDSQVPMSELVGGRGGVSVSWTGGHNASRGYVVEWIPTCSFTASSVQWERISSSNTSFLIQSGTLEAGIRYTVSVFALLSEAIVLLQRHHTYVEELVPSTAVDGILAHQSGSDVVLTWNPVSVCNQSSFIRGYTIYTTHGSNISLIGNISDPSVTQYRVKSLVLGSYKFMVRWFSSAGESSSSTIFIRTESENLIVVQILVALGIMSLSFIIISIFCYKKREWVKKAFYPEIPGPKLTGDWTTPTAPLDVKPPPHSLVHIVESLDKEGLMTQPEELDGGQGDGDEDVEMDMDSDEPAPLRYYNQLVSDTSGFSSSSADSADTQVTYADVQSPAYRPQTQPTAHLWVESQLQEVEENLGGGAGGYKPQCAWRSMTPEHENFGGSLGSPTSITSSQFLIPETEEQQQASGTWFYNLISGKF